MQNRKLITSFLIILFYFGMSASIHDISAEFEKSTLDISNWSKSVESVTFSKDGYAYVTKGGNVLKYNEDDHLKKMEVKEVGSFGDDDLSVPPKVSTDFSLD